MRALWLSDLLNDQPLTPKHLKLLCLLLREGRPLAMTELEDGVYGDDPSGGPEDARRCILVFICFVRKALKAPWKLVRSNGGYWLTDGPTPLKIDCKRAPATFRRGLSSFRTPEFVARVLATRRKGFSLAECAEILQCSSNTVHRICKSDPACQKISQRNIHLSGQFRDWKKFRYGEAA